MGLLMVEVPQGNGCASAQILELHRGPSSPLLDHSQHLAIAAERRLRLLRISKPGWRLTGLGPAADQNQTHASHDCSTLGDVGDRRLASHRWFSRLPLQSSNRELLSRGRELRGAGRLEALVPDSGRPAVGLGLLPVIASERTAEAPLERGPRGEGLKAASSGAGRMGLPWGIPEPIGSWSLPSPWLGPPGAELERGLLDSWAGVPGREAVGRLPRRCS